MQTDEHYERIGAWVQATGTVVASLGVSPFYTHINFDNTLLPTSNVTEEQANQFAEHLGQIGNILQATGNGIEALGADTPLEMIGNEIGASGNLTVLYSLQPDLQKSDVYYQLIVGNLLQAYGAYLAGLSERTEANMPSQVSAYGNFTQTLGNSLQAYGAFQLLQGYTVLGNQYIFIGSWIQTFGAVTAAVGTSLESEKGVSQ